MFYSYVAPSCFCIPLLIFRLSFWFPWILQWCFSAGVCVTNTLPLPETILILPEFWVVVRLVVGCFRPLPRYPLLPVVLFPTPCSFCWVLASDPPVLALCRYFFHLFEYFRYAYFRVFHILLFFTLGVRTLLDVHPRFLGGVCGPRTWEAPCGRASRLCGPNSGFPIPTKFLCFECWKLWHITVCPSNSTRKGQMSYPFVACRHSNWWHMYEFQVYVNRTGEASC